MPTVTRKRLVCVVEGKGDVKALPALCARIIQYLGGEGWDVEDTGIRCPRGKLVDERAGSGRGGAHPGLPRFMELVMGHRPDAVLIVCDADDDCPGKWAESVGPIIEARCIGAAVMAVREFEAWLVASQLRTDSHDGRPIETIRNAKSVLAQLHPGYLPTAHQLKLTRSVDVEPLRGWSRSFDKLVRTLAKLIGVLVPIGATAPSARSETKRARSRR